eukprot:scaffold127578_cov69-Phaeocystis_antarctica.AAC.4
MPKQSNCFVDPANGTVHLVSVMRLLETSLADRSPHELDASEALYAADMHARLASEGDNVLGAGVKHLLRVVKGSHVV